METEIGGGKSFGFLKVTLHAGESVICEAGAMASMDTSIGLRSRMNGGFFNALLIKFLGNESFFINKFFNRSTEKKELVLTQPTPGQMLEAELKDETLYLQPGAYIASTPGVRFAVRWAGFSSFLAGEGLFRLKIHGTGKVWYGAFGSVVEKEVSGSYIVDSGHLLSYPPTVKLKIQLAGGLFSSFFSGEGLVLRLEGKGKIKLQTRSLGGLAGWLNPRFIG